MRILIDSFGFPGGIIRKIPVVVANPADKYQLQKVLKKNLRLITTYKMKGYYPDF
jgi:hypothetical protein